MDKKLLIIQLLHYNWDKSSYKGEKEEGMQRDFTGGGGKSPLRK